MQNLISETAVLNNDWQYVENIDQALPDGKVLVDAQNWLDNRELFKDHQTAILFSGDADLEAYGEYLEQFSMVAVNFPAFADGRGYSIARLLKERFNFKGEIRAMGDVLIDQLFFMKRCGFDTYLLKEGLSGEKALSYFATFKDPYQLAYDTPTPLFRRKG